MTLTIVRGHVVERPARELDTADANRITAALAAQGIHVQPVVDVFHVVHLWPAEPLPTDQANVAVRAFCAVTDCRVAYHDPRPPVAATCLLCGAAGELEHDLCGGCASRLAGREAVAS